MTCSPAVSVIVPTYNRASLVEEAVASVLRQTYADLECIVVDDGSTDGTEAVVRGLGDSRIRYLRHHVNRGGGAARNTGIQAARGRFIAFQDSDNEWFPKKLEKQVAVLEGAPADSGVVYTGCWKVKGENRNYNPVLPAAGGGGRIHLPLLWGNFIDTPALLVRRECFEMAGMFDESLPRFQDWDLALRLSVHYSFCLIDEPLYAAYEQEDSISANSAAAVDALGIIFEKYRDEIASDASLLGHYWHWLGMVHLENGDRAAAIAEFLKAVRTDPLCLKYLLSLALGSLRPQALVRLVGWNQRRKNRIATGSRELRGDEGF